MRKRAQNEDDVDGDFNEMYPGSEYGADGDDGAWTIKPKKGEEAVSYVKFEESLSDGEGLEALVKRTEQTEVLEQPHNGSLSDGEGLEILLKRSGGLGMLVR